MKKILIIEDNRINQELIIEVLKTMELEIDFITAFDGIAGIQSMRREIPDLILLDIQLPEIDGYEVLKVAKSDPVTASIPIIGVTAYATREDEKKIIEAGFENYITKPINITSFISKVREVLNNGN